MWNSLINCCNAVIIYLYSLFNQLIFAANKNMLFTQNQRSQVVKCAVLNVVYFTNIYKTIQCVSRPYCTKLLLLLCLCLNLTPIHYSYNYFILYVVSGNIIQHQRYQVWGRWQQHIPPVLLYLSVSRSK